MRPARVGIDLSSLWRPGVASDKTVAAGLLEGLIAIDVDRAETVVAVDHHAPTPLPPELDGFEVVRFRGGPRMFSNPSSLFGAYRRAGVAAGLYHHFGPVRTAHGSVTLVHDLVHLTDPAAFGPVEVRYLNLRKRSVRRSTRVLSPSHATARELVRHGYRSSEDGIDVVTWGARPLSDRGPHRPPPALAAPDEPFVLTVGRVTERKRLPLAAAITERSTERRLVVVGPIESPAIADELARLPHVEVLGPVADVELEWLYRHARATLLTSRSEGFGLPLIEAVQRGCPVLCSDLPVFREVGEGLAGVAYFDADVDDAPTAAARLLTGLVDGVRPDPGAFPDRFSWEHTARTVLSSLRRAT